MKWCPTPRLMAVLTAALLVSLFAVSGFAQFQTGNIYGKVQAKDGSVLPGVTVTLTGVGAPATQVTDAQGNFRFLNLSPGSYTLKAELAGYGTATRAGVGVRVGANSDVTLTLNPSVSESITVTAEAPLLDVRKAGDATNVTRVEMEKVPSARDPWSVMQTTPGVQVDRINVGGSQSGQQSVYVAKGAQTTDNTWNMDGVNITDMGATGSTPLYFDFDSFEEMQVTTGGSDPRIMTPGVQLNMVTKRGTNDFRGSGRYFYTPGSYQAAGTIPAEATGYLAATNEIKFVRDYGAEIGGPLWRDHLWAWLADAEQKISNTNTATIGQFISPDNIILRDKNAKLNAQILPSNSAVGFYTFGDKVRNARNLSPTRPFEASWRQTGPTKVYKLEDTQIVGSSLYLTGMWSKVTGGFSLIPNGGFGASAPPITVVGPPFNGGVWAGGYEAYITDRPQKQYRLDGSKFFDLGSMNHELKFGFGYRNTPVSSISTWGGASQGYWIYNTPGTNDAGYNCADEGLPADCLEAALIRDRQAAYGEHYKDAYIGDTILMGNLTLQVGLRMDRQDTTNQPSLTAAQPVIGTPLTLPCAPDGFCSGNYTGSLASLNFPGDPQSLKWRSVTPRVGLTYTLGADKKTLLRAGYNRYASQVGSIITNGSPNGTTSYFYLFGRDLNGDKTIQRNELLQWYSYYYISANAPNALVSNTRIDYGMKVPKADEFMAGFERELFTDFSVGLTGTYRKYHDLTGFRYEKTQGAGDWYTAADFTPLVVNGQQVFAGGSFTQTAANGGNTFTTGQVPIYVLKPGVAPLSAGYRALTNLPGYTQEYKGVELTATKRLSHSWMMRANASWNDYTEQCSAESNPNPTPFLNNCPGGQVVVRSAGSGAFGNVFINSKWNFNLTGLYQLPLDFSLGASLTGRQGYPSPYRERVSGAALGSTYTRNRVDAVLNPIGEQRFDNVYELDLRAAKDFRFFNRVGITLSADLFNALNQRTILQRETLLGTLNARTLATSVNSGGGRITELQSPRVWRFGARFNF
jgi:hypothetical protein